MPILHTSSFKPSWFFRNAHTSTIYPSLFRKIPSNTYTRTRISTPDNDFLDVDFLNSNNKRIVILCHGLEGNSGRAYVRGMAKALQKRNYAVAAMNYRGCSGDMNKKLRLYHSGATEDLHTVVQYLQQKGYEQISLVGFSLGANLVLKYLGEYTNENIYRAAVVAPPCDLKSASDEIGKPHNILYAKKFLKSLKHKVKQKQQQFPEYKFANLEQIKTLYEFDNAYTAPLHGFKSANDYYAQCQSGNYILAIQTPTLMIAATNDPILPKACIPYEHAQANEHTLLLVSNYGGHVGFPSFQTEYWHETMACNFLSTNNFRDLVEI